MWLKPLISTEYIEQIWLSYLCFCVKKKCNCKETLWTPCIIGPENLHVYKKVAKKVNFTRIHLSHIHEWTNYAPHCYIAGYADAGCQTELTMDDIEKMEDVLRQNSTELVDLRTKTLDTVQPGVLWKKIKKRLRAPQLLSFISDFWAVRAASPTSPVALCLCCLNLNSWF